MYSKSENITLNLIDIDLIHFSCRETEPSIVSIAKQILKFIWTTSLPMQSKKTKEIFNWEITLYI